VVLTRIGSFGDHLLWQGNGCPPRKECHCPSS
jgi:hypothetical protein